MTNILEPKVATSTSTVKSDALTMDTLDPSVVVGRVDFPTVNTSEVVDHGALDDRKAPERVAIEPRIGEGSSSAFDMNKEVGETVCDLAAIPFFLSICIWLGGMN